MSDKRMFTMKIVDSDAFLDMPASSRLLYYDLAMRADDDGFNGSPKRVLKITGASVDDLNVLISKKFIIPFENGVIVIKHWRLHNTIRHDLYHPTTYGDLKAQLYLDENGAYSTTPPQIREEKAPHALQILPKEQTAVTGSLRVRNECVTGPLRDSNVDKNSIDKDKNRLDPGLEKQRSVPLLYFPENEILNSAFSDFVENRKKLRKPMTPKAVSLAIDKLNKLSNGNTDLAVEIINQSIMNGWAGLFEINTGRRKGIDWEHV